MKTNKNQTKNYHTPEENGANDMQSMLDSLTTQAMCDAAFHTRKCDTLVDIKMLKSHMDLLITHALCKS